MKSIEKRIRILGITLCAVMAVMAMSAVCFAETEQPSSGLGPVQYTDENSETQILQEDQYKLVDMDVFSSGLMGNEGETSWYVSYGGSIMQRVKVQGDVRLVLVNGTELKAESGIEVPEGSSLSIYSHKVADKEWGRLIATGSTMDAGIGSNGTKSNENPQNCGTINVYGGWIKATGGQYGAGIGGGYGRVSNDEEYGGDGGTFLMKDGVVTAQGGGLGAGIGGGRRGDSGTITIKGGFVTATAGSGGAGIGGGEGLAGTTSDAIVGSTTRITITGGEVKAYGANDTDGYGGGAGIGGGKGANGSKGDYNENKASGRSGNENKILITGGKIEARGADNGGAGIGGGMHSINDWYERGAGANVEIRGGEVYAYGGAQAAGIGATRCESEGSGDTIITGGKVVARGGDYAAGIGTGNDPHRMAVNADWTKLYNIEITDSADVTAIGGKEAAGIGCGNEGLRSAGAHGKLTISGDAKVTAQGGKYGAGIGGGDQNVNGTTDISGNAVVNATGGYGGAGIGLGDDVDKESYTSRVTIRGGIVNAAGGEYGAGIGGGDTSDMLFALDITGGRVTAKAGREAAGIGGGNHTSWSGGGNGGSVSIDLPVPTGSTFAPGYVYAISGKDAAPIGRGDAGDSDGKLALKSRVSVKSSDTETSYNVIDETSPVDESRRVSTCQNTDITEVLIQNCPHKGISYKDESVWRHAIYCGSCGYTSDELHDPDEANCKKCKSDNYIVTFKEGADQRKEYFISVKPGASYTFPKGDPSQVPEGKIFAGWTDGKDTMKAGQSRYCLQNEIWTAAYADRVVISFAPGEGSGTMQSLDQMTGDIIDLPECRFTAPEGMDFYRWQLGESSYYPDRSTYEVGSESVTFTALWKEHTHDFKGGHHEAIAATCTEPGSLEYWQCNDCKRYYRDDQGQTEIAKGDIPVPARGHLWEEPVYTWSEDLTRVMATRVCLNDAAGDHTEKETVYTAAKIPDPSCKEQGMAEYTATFENPAFAEQTKTVPVEKKAHTWGQWTDNGDGTETRACSECGAEETREADHVHTMIAHDRVEPLCEKQGKKAYWECEKCGRLYADEAGNQEITDEGSLGIPAAGHKFEDPVSEVINEATCDQEGAVKVSRDCERCNFVRIDIQNPPALGHNWDSGIVTRAASCEEPGEKTFTCLNDAAHTRTEEISALGHDWTEWKEETGEDGVTYDVRSCTRCDAVEKVSRGKAECAHEHVKTIEGTPATCEESGLKDRYQCEDCQVFLIKGEDDSYTAVTSEEYDQYMADQEIRPLGHNWGEPSYKWVADFSAVTGTCSCGRDKYHVLTETAKAESKVVKEATATAVGEIQYTAVFDSDVFTVQVRTEPIKIAQKLTVKKKTVKVKAKKVRKKARKVKPLTVKGAKTKVTYKGVGVNKKSRKALKINSKTGKIKVRKKTKKGTYKMKVTISAAASATYKPVTRTVTVTVKVKK